MMAAQSRAHRALFMITLIIAGEAVFLLPFHLARFFRPTVLEVFGLTPTELGAAQGVYGVLAMLAYFPGGPIADRFPARKLLAISLWSTAAGGLYMATFPDYRGSAILWGFFGVTTILCFWAALIRATREWGGHDEQGRAYGLLEGGRGILAAVMASFGILLFTLTFPENYSAASLEQKRDTLRLIIYGYIAVTAAGGALVWFVIRDAPPAGDAGLASWRPRQESVGRHILRVLRMPAVWLQAVIVVCAYVGYKGFDSFSLFAVEAYGVDEVEAARIVAIGTWLRPVAAIGMGLLGDRFNASRMIMILFALLLASDLFLGLTAPVAGAYWVLFGNVLITCIAIFGFRGLYYALLEEVRVPATVTGTAVGFVSVVGYTPDIFVNYVAGVLIDGTPGVGGHQHFFLFLAVFSFTGLAASLALMHLLRRQSAVASSSRSGNGYG